MLLRAFEPFGDAETLELGVVVGLVEELLQVILVPLPQRLIDFLLGINASLVPIRRKQRLAGEKGADGGIC